MSDLGLSGYFYPANSRSFFLPVVVFSLPFPISQVVPNRPILLAQNLRESV